ncbi:putative spermidine/putrescine transport system ATP-binding protein [Cohaesibacter sp. ES.047]|uniref:ABC transporter ATP-binding protein n=1 Tax=Cohaesibacter sp. ES.047 TaxID=1798205 RepID=UPI000BB71BB9|nr:ABC transporter ATP-binding protein [Cohaesibacter sp. ES.047]SNY92193.1 putative spermidine/putrescine transport system ATP-binding protein [Cohaesibacter sp. ES.047]
MSKLTIEHLAKSFGNTAVVRDLNFIVEQGEMVALLGPSGCGKSTTLRMIAGFETPSSGRILFGQEDVTSLPPYRRDVGMVFQSYALFPHMSVAANVGFGLEMRKLGRADRDKRIKDALEMVRLEHLADRMPGQLSGGQQQRVALARALAVNPALLLLDEPLSNLDAKLRAEVQHEIRDLQQRLGVTTLIVTHDQEEALIMADRMAVMEGGVLRQIGSPRALYDRPENVFVAGFVGQCNLVEGSVSRGGSFTSASGVDLPCRAHDTLNGDAIFALRPEKISLDPQLKSPRQASVLEVTYLGAQTEYKLDLGGTSLVATISTPAEQTDLAGLTAGMKASVDWAAEDAHLLPPNT